MTFTLEIEHLVNGRNVLVSPLLVPLDASLIPRLKLEEHVGQEYVHQEEQAYEQVRYEEEHVEVVLVVGGEHHVRKVGSRQQYQHARVRLGQRGELYESLERETEHVESNDGVGEDPRENRHHDRRQGPQVGEEV